MPGRGAASPSPIKTLGLGISFKRLGLGREGQEHAGELCGCCLQELGCAEPDPLLGVPGAARGAGRSGGDVPVAVPSATEPGLRSPSAWQPPALRGAPAERSLIDGVC